MVERLVKTSGWHYDFTLTEAGMERRKQEWEKRANG